MIDGGVGKLGAGELPPPWAIAIQPATKGGVVDDRLLQQGRPGVMGTRLGVDQGLPERKIELYRARRWPLRAIKGLGGGGEP